MLNSLGLIETRSLVGSIAAADLMLKTGVQIIGKSSMNSGEVILIIEGEEKSVNLAVEAAAGKAREMGELKSTFIIPKPEAGLEKVFRELTVFKEDLSADKKIEIEKKTSVRPDVMEKEIKRKVKEKKIEEPPADSPETDKITEEKLKEEVIPEKPEEKKSVEKSKPKKEKKVKANHSDFSLFDQTNDTISRLRREALLNDKDDIDVEENIEKEDETVAGGEEINDEISAGKNIRLDNETADNSDPDNLPRDLEKLNVHKLRRLARSIEGFPIKGREISKANREVLLGYFNNLD